MESRHISQLINADPKRVYEFAADPGNLSRWAAGLAQSELRREGDELIASSPMGEVRVRFVPQNDFGVLDHDVTLPSGDVVNNPLRVLTHPDGAEVVFTVQQLGASDEDFERDCAAVASDLAKLRDLIEAPR